MADVFVSYAREDQEFVQRLAAALAERGQEAWGDWNIQPSDDYRDSIREEIDAADAFLFVLSADSLTSKPCRDEVDHAVAGHKRIVVVQCRDVEGLEIPPEIERINWVRMRPGDDFRAGLERLERALALDLDLARIHTRVLTRAKAWELSGRRPTPLLRGEELRAAQDWLARAAAGAQPQPTELQAAFVQESRMRATRRQRITVGGSLSVAVIAVALATFALISRAQARHEARVANSRALAARAQAELGSNPDDAVRLAAQAVRTQQTGESLHTLAQALDAARLRTVLQQRAAVTAVAFSPRGDELAAGGADGVVRVWSIPARRLLFTEGRGQLPVNALQFDHGGDLVAVARNGNANPGCSVELLDASAGALVHTLDAGESAVCARYPVFLGSSSSLAVGLQDGTIDVWNAATGKLSGQLTALRSPGVVVVALSASRDGRYLAAVEPHVVRVLDASGKPVTDIHSTVAIFNPGSVAFGPRDSQLVIGGEYNTEIDDIQFHTQLFLDNQFGAASVAWSPNGRLAAAAIHDATYVWSAVSGRRVEVLNGRSSQPFSPVAFSPTGLLAAGSQDGSVSIWDPDPNLAAHQLGGGNQPAGYSLQYAGAAPRLGLAAVGDATGTVFVVDSQDRPLARLQPQGDAPFAVSADGVLAFVRSGRILRLRLPSGQVLSSTSTGLSTPNSAMAASADGGVVATLTQDGNLTVLSPGALRTRRIGFTPSSSNSLSLRADGSLLAVTGSPVRGTVTIYRTHDLAPVRRYAATAASFSSSGSLLALERSDLQIDVIRSDAFQTQVTLAGESYGEANLAFSADGRIVFALDGNGVLRGWDATDGTLLATRQVVEGLYPGRLAVPSVAPIGNGSVVTGVDEDGAIETFAVCSRCLDQRALLARADQRQREIQPIAGP